MDRLLRVVLVVGVLNLLALGLIACGEDGNADVTLAARVGRLEAWQPSVEQRLVAEHNFITSQAELNTTMHQFMASAKDHAVSTDARLQRQLDAFNQLAEIVKDILKRK